MAASGNLLVKLVKNWSSRDKEDALALFKKSYASFSQDNVLTPHETSSLQGLFYDLFSLSLIDKIDTDEVGEFCRSLMVSLDSPSVLSSLLADILSSLDAEVMCSDDKSLRKAFRSLVLSLVCVVGEDLLKERLDMDTLELSGFITSKNNYNQKYVKTKTKLYYKQQKFNLFREESEGYSKLIAELGHEPLTGVNHQQVLDSIKSLIGRFSMDPNRVLDIIFQVFECCLDERHFFIPLLKDYPCQPSTFINILGFKFHKYNEIDPETGRTTPTPSSLYNLTAILLNEGMIDLKALGPHLSLSLEEFTELHQSIMETAQSIYKKANIVSLTDKTDEEKEKEAEAAQKLKDYHDSQLSLEYNQLLGICHACLLQGDWPSARSIMDQLPPHLTMGSPQIVQSLCQLLTYSIEPVYRLHAPRASTPSPTPSLSLSQCHSFSDMVPMVMEMFDSLGPRLHSDPVLLCKLVRLGKAYFKELFPVSDVSRTLTSEHLENELLRWFITVINSVILPSLSLLQCNCGMAEEVWSMIRLLPYETRYMLYGYWKNESYMSHPDLMIIKSETLTKGKYIMKRLTKDNVKQSGRLLGKLNNSNPGIIFDYVLSQIQRYDNFISPVVDSLKYLTPLAYDILAYCIIEALGNPQKERLKLEDTNLSSWLQGLASFSANVFKKYPIELTGLLQYVTNQLKAGKSFDLLVLKEVIQKMAGIEISDEITAAQLEAMSGGELLKAEGGYFSQVRNTKKSSQRLREALVDSNLCLPLCLLTAQQRDCIVFRDGSNLHLKLVCSMYDNCMDTLVQFGGFLSSHLSPEEYSKRVPSLDTLIQEYRMTGDVAFFLYRPKIFSNIGVKFAELEKSFKNVTNESKKTIMTRQEKHFVSACEEIFGPIIDSVKPLQPPKVWDDINCSFYVAFWSLSLYDLHIPKERYNDEINKAKDVIQSLENNQEMPASKKKKEQERSQALIDKLLEEKKRQEDNNQLIIGWLRNQKDSFLNPRVVKSRALTRLLQLCIFPRCCFTTLDAVYCAKFIHTLHILETPNFSTLLLLDRVFSDLSYTVSACTENEVRRYGHFLYQLLEMIGRWHNSESVYTAECANTPGFISMMKSSASGNEKQNLDYENYRHITFKWHFKLTKSLVVCLESKDYIQIRNGLILLTKILPHYPKVQHLSMALEKRVGKIIEEEKEKRQDLYILAIGYAGMLKSQGANLIPETEFHKKDDKVRKEDLSGPEVLSNGRDDRSRVEKPKTEKTKPSPAEKPKSSTPGAEKPKPSEKPKVTERSPKVPEKSKPSETKGSAENKSSRVSSSSSTDKVSSSSNDTASRKTTGSDKGGDVKATSKTTAGSDKGGDTKTVSKTATGSDKGGDIKATSKTAAGSDKGGDTKTVSKSVTSTTGSDKGDAKTTSKTSTTTTGSDIKTTSKTTTTTGSDKAETKTISKPTTTTPAAPDRPSSIEPKTRHSDDKTTDKTLKNSKTEDATSQATPTSSDSAVNKGIKKTDGEAAVRATPTSTTPSESKKGVLTTPTFDTKKVPILSLEKLPSGRVSRSGSSSESDSPRHAAAGQRRPHLQTPDSQSGTESLDKVSHSDPKRRKVEETTTAATPNKARVSTTTPSTPVTTGGDKNGGLATPATAPKPERKRERLPDKDTVTSDGVKKRRESAPADALTISKETVQATPSETKKRMIKVVKTEKVGEPVKKKPKSPPSVPASDKDEKTKKIVAPSTARPPAKK